MNYTPSWMSYKGQWMKEVLSENKTQSSQTGRPARPGRHAGVRQASPAGCETVATEHFHSPLLPARSFYRSGPVLAPSLWVGVLTRPASFTSAPQGLHPARQEGQVSPKDAGHEASLWGRGTCVLTTPAQVRNQWLNSYSSLPWCPTSRFNLSHI